MSATDQDPENAGDDASQAPGKDWTVTGRSVSAGEEGVRVIQSANPKVVDRGIGERVPEPLPVAPTKPVAPSEPVVEETLEDFEALLEEETRSGEDRTGFAKGERVSGVVEVISVHGQEIFLDLGIAVTGYIMKEEFLDDAGELTVGQGDVIEGTVLGTDANGVRIGSVIGLHGGDLDLLRDAKDAGLPVQGRVVGLNKGGYEVQVAGARAFCPHSQIDLYRLDEPESVLNQTFKFLVTEIKGRDGVVISRAAFLKAEREERAEETRASIREGAVLEGHVRSIQKFGAFVDLGGVDGLVHVGELSWSRVDEPSDVVSMGQKVKVVVLEVDSDRERISLSMKRAQKDPFEEALESIRPGEIVEGRVARLTNFGAFINLAPNVDGLVHISDLAHFRVHHPKEVLAVGDVVRVKVMEIDTDRRRIGLSLKALADDPWDTVTSRYAPDQSVKGTVRKIETFGVFVELEQGITALLPASESGVAQGQSLNRAFKVGEPLEATVLRVDSAARRMALTVRSAEDRGDNERRGGQRRGGGRGRPAMAWKDQDPAPAQSTGGSLGSFGALLQKALDKEDE